MTPECQSIVDSALGQELENNECQVLSSQMKISNINDGEILVKKGDEDSRLFILISGQLAVINDANGENKSVYTMNSGEVAGTRAFVDRSPRCATLQAIGNTQVYTFEPERLEDLLDKHPHIVYKVMRGLFRITHMNLMRMNNETQQLSNYINKTGGRY